MFLKFFIVNNLLNSAKAIAEYKFHLLTLFTVFHYIDAYLLMSVQL